VGEALRFDPPQSRGQDEILSLEPLRLPQRHSNQTLVLELGDRDWCCGDRQHARLQTRPITCFVRLSHLYIRRRRGTSPAAATCNDSSIVGNVLPDGSGSRELSSGVRCARPLSRPGTSMSSFRRANQHDGELATHEVETRVRSTSRIIDYTRGGTCHNVLPPFVAPA